MCTPKRNYYGAYGCSPENLLDQTDGLMFPDRAKLFVSLFEAGDFGFKDVENEGWGFGLLGLVFRT